MHPLNQARRIGSVFVSALRLPLSDDGLAWDTFGDKEIGNSRAAASADDDLLEATILPR